MRFLLFFHLVIAYTHFQATGLSRSINFLLHFRSAEKANTYDASSQSLAIGSGKAALSHRVNIHSSSSLHDEVNFPQNGFAVDSNHCFGKQFLFWWLSWLMNRALCSENIPPGKKSGKHCFGSVRNLCAFNFQFDSKYIRALILRRETASRNCYWFYSERIAQNFNDDVWNGRNKGPNPKMRQRR